MALLRGRPTFVCTALRPHPHERIRRSAEIETSAFLADSFLLGGSSSHAFTPSGGYDQVGPLQRLAVTGPRNCCFCAGAPRRYFGSPGARRRELPSSSRSPDIAFSCCRLFPIFAYSRTTACAVIHRKPIERKEEFLAIEKLRGPELYTSCYPTGCVNGQDGRIKPTTFEPVTLIATISGAFPRLADHAVHDVLPHLMH